ncbi:ribosomal protein L22e [Lentinula edodes]|uniref:ribosomal protein L22e n=1 Tax=Lentinula edodes TaxID=5353 RepID=UPI001E8E65AD|nr:ribosomal protein L22e [Lentinula edodes]KAH7880583.1 ribosomal protein L22e [Lentinula edodes]
MVSWPKAAAGKVATKHKFVIDYSKPAGDQVFDGADFEKFLHDRIKVAGKAGQLGDNVKIARDSSNNKITVTSNIPLSKRYLKYLTKKFLKKNTLRDWIRYDHSTKMNPDRTNVILFSVVATTKDSYTLKFFNISTDNDEDEE